MRNEKPCGCTPYRQCEPCFRAGDREQGRDLLQREEDEANYRALVVEPTVEWLNRG